MLDGTPSDAGAPAPPSTSAPPSAPPVAPPVATDAGASDAAPASGTCASNADCPALQYCRTAACGDATGTCAPQPPSGAECLASSPGAVCGCDHETYPNACWAAAFGENVAAAGECVLPTGGACVSQADCGGDSYAGTVFCSPAACGTTAGTCERVPASCAEIFDPVCGCDGASYNNACSARQAKVGVAYGGPCRSGAAVACSAPADCPGEQTCVVDATACAGGGSCTGTCAATSEESCGAEGDLFFKCGGINSPATQACTTTLCAGGLCAACVFTTAASCSPDAPCPSGQLCVPALDPGGSGLASQSFCVVP
jgi:hypothetical protein